MEGVSPFNALTYLIARISVPMQRFVLCLVAEVGLGRHRLGVATIPPATATGLGELSEKGRVDVAEGSTPTTPAPHARAVRARQPPGIQTIDCPGKESFG